MTRDEARALRGSLPEAARRAWSARIMAAILDWNAYARSRTVMAYASIGSEVQTHALLREIALQGKRLVLPRCAGRGMMDAAPCDDLTRMAKGRYGILEPPGDARAVPRDEIDLILVPGLLFDRWGARLGQGAGYYDRYLAGYAGMTCGVAFAAQVLDRRLAVQPHDVPVRAIVTERGLCDGLQGWTLRREREDGNAEG